MNLSAVRNSLPVTKKWNYLNNAVVSPLPTPVKEAMNGFEIQRESDCGPSYAKWFQDVEVSRDVVSKSFNSSGHEIAFFGSTSHALNSVAQMIPLKRGDEVVLTDLEFPSNTFPWVFFLGSGSERYWVRIGWCKSLDGTLNPKDIERRIGSRTKVIAISHVCYYNGFKGE